MSKSEAATTNPQTSVIRRAASGDESAIVELRGVLDNKQVAEVLGNLSRRIEGQLIDHLGRNDPVLSEALPRKLQNMREELAGPNASTLEKQLIERVVLCWLTVHHAEHQFGRMGNLPSTQVETWQKRIDQAHRRYLSAVKMLATVRKLAIPIIVGQINIARNQVNLELGP